MNQQRRQRAAGSVVTEWNKAKVDLGGVSDRQGVFKVGGKRKRTVKTHGHSLTIEHERLGTRDTMGVANAFIDALDDKTIGHSHSRLPGTGADLFHRDRSEWTILYWFLGCGVERSMAISAKPVPGSKAHPADRIAREYMREYKWQLRNSEKAAKAKATKPQTVTPHDALLAALKREIAAFKRAR